MEYGGRCGSQANIFLQTGLRGQILLQLFLSPLLKNIPQFGCYKCKCLHLSEKQKTINMLTNVITFRTKLQSIFLLQLIEGLDLWEKVFALPQRDFEYILYYLCSYYRKRFVFEMFRAMRFQQSMLLLGNQRHLTTFLLTISSRNSTRKHKNGC